ncbi:transcription factor ETV7 isoform X2 [Marmota monax]|uniref:transcription factor ETV7 isoform X2 n=1 Tax=Marmota monax TaxID=9995 RepID=UPI001EB06A3B|nr:transcription factor ETV7 isoform X2 [Marmota monax]
MQEGTLAYSPVGPAAATHPLGTQVQARCEAQVQLLGETGICKLPGRLRLQPALWSREDVLHWLRWAEQEYSLPRTPERGFQLNGRALCILTKDDFRRRAPGSGDVLYELLQFIKTQRRALVCRPFLPGTCRQRTRPGLPQAPEEGIGPSQAAPQPTAKCLLSQPPALGLASSFSHLGSLSPARQPLRLSHCAEPGCRTRGVCSFPRMPRAPIDGRIAGPQGHGPHGSSVLTCRLPPAVGLRVPAAPGRQNRVNMTYEKMSHALRHYYKLNIIRKEPGQKLLFRFLKTP